MAGNLHSAADSGFLMYWLIERNVLEGSKIEASQYVAFGCLLRCRFPPAISRQSKDD